LYDVALTNVKKAYPDWKFLFQ